MSETTSKLLLMTLLWWGEKLLWKKLPTRGTGTANDFYFKMYRLKINSVSQQAYSKYAGIANGRIYKFCMDFHFNDEKVLRFKMKTMCRRGEKWRGRTAKLFTQLLLELRQNYITTKNTKASHLPFK